MLANEPADFITYTLTDDDGGNFYIDNNELYTSGSTLSLTEETFTFTVKAADTLGNSGTHTFTLSAYTTPTDIEFAGEGIAEDTPVGTFIGTLSSTDADSSSFTYTLPDGSDVVEIKNGDEY